MMCEGGHSHILSLKLLDIYPKVPRVFASESQDQFINQTTCLMVYHRIYHFNFRFWAEQW